MKTDTASGIYGVYIGNEKCSHNALVTKKTDIFKMTKSQNLTDSQVSLGWLSKTKHKLILKLEASKSLLGLRAKDNKSILDTAMNAYVMCEATELKQPSIHQPIFLCLPNSGWGGGLTPIPAVTGWKARCSLDRSIVYNRANHITK